MLPPILYRSNWELKSGLAGRVAARDGRRSSVRSVAGLSIAKRGGLAGKRSCFVGSVGVFVGLRELWAVVDVVSWSYDGVRCQDQGIEGY